MRTILTVAAILAIGLSVHAIRMVELGAFLDVAPAPVYGIAGDDWMPGLGAYAHIAIGPDAALRMSLATPFERMIVRIGIEFVRSERARTTLGGLVSAASAIGGPVGGQVDVGFFLTPIHNETWSLRIAGFPFGAHANNVGGTLRGRAFIPFNVSVDASLAVSDRNILRQSAWGALLLAPGLGEPLLPFDEAIRGLTRVSLQFGMRLP